MNYGSITQIAIFILAVAIVFTYIQPTFVSIAALQSNIDQYQAALDQTSTFNATLSKLVGEVDGFAAKDIHALDTYLPSSIDELQVMADITAIALQSGVSLDSLAAGDVTEPNNDVVVNGENVENNSASVSQDFEISVSGSYDSFKNFLSKLELNKYPLEVAALQFGATTDTKTTTVTNTATPDGSYSVTLRTYAFTNQQ